MPGTFLQTAFSGGASRIRLEWLAASGAVIAVCKPRWLTIKNPEIIKISVFQILKDMTTDPQSKIFERALALFLYDWRNLQADIKAGHPMVQDGDNLYHVAARSGLDMAIRIIHRIAPDIADIQAPNAQNHSPLDLAKSASKTACADLIACMEQQIKKAKHGSQYKPLKP